MTLPARRRRRERRGQAEVIGGLLVLTLLFVFAVPLLVTSLHSVQKAGVGYTEKMARRAMAYNEKLAVQPVNPADPMVQRLGWVPGVFINNTGTVDVTIDRIYLINFVDKTVYAVLDSRYLRPEVNPLVKTVLKNVVLVNGTLSWEDPPPAGVPITLRPGENILVVFDESLASVAPYLVVRVESAEGVMHPVAAGGGQGPSTGVGAGAGGEGTLWRGLLYPQTGFKLHGAGDLQKYGMAYTWVPPLFVYPADSQGNPTTFSYYESFIYSDPDYPGLYYIKIVLNDDIRLVVTYDKYGWPSESVRLRSGWTIELRGFVGTYETFYFSGYAFKVIIRNPSGQVVREYPDNWGLPSTPLNLGNSGITTLDFDGNGVDELVFYSFLNAPTISSTVNIDVDGQADTSPAPNDEYRDAVVWTYVIARDISGVDFIRVSAKINYYWTNVFISCPSSFRKLSIFRIAILRYDNSTGEWKIYHYRNYDYVDAKPVQFQPSITFPVERNGTYRVALMFYDNYRDWDYGYVCYKDFTYGLEYVMVEYGVVNPYLFEAPPVYIVAIPDPSIIHGIGEEEYMALKGLDNLDEAKIGAQQDLLKLVENELGYAGIPGYTVITSREELYNLLFKTGAGAEVPPKYAVIIWLQGDVDVSTVLGAYGVTDSDFKSYVGSYHWLWVWVSGQPFGGEVPASIYFNGNVVINGPGSYLLNITSNGLKARGEFYALYLLEQVLFNYTTTPQDASCIVEGSDFYWNPAANPPEYGTVAYWVDCSPGTGALLVNPVHIDWDRSGDGALPETVAQQVVYAALYAWKTISSG
ncbi:hypothetical protein [Stetteria hydrogenophila]